MTKKHLTDQRFADLDLIDTLKQGVADAGFEYCTPIQASSLPVALNAKDVAGQAQTGTGKTVAFLLACCQHLLVHPAPASRQPTNARALILAPTRELAIQIYKDAEVLAKHTELKLGLIYGGTGYDEQKQMLAKGVDILIGTPGRLIDFYKQNLFDLKLVQVVVLDEADRMFDLGFIKDIRYLLRRMPKPEDRLNMLFSATLSFRVMELAYEHMNNPEEIKIDADMRVADKIDEVAYYPADEEKAALLINLLRRDRPERVLVFVNTRYAADEVSRTLSANGISNAALSGDVPQPKRERILEHFKSGKYNVLVATDVAARGLHIPEVSHVFNYDLPQDADDYVHRIGRTARAGHSGEAISFICEKYAYSIMEIESFIGHAISREEIEPELLTPIETVEKAVRQYRGKSSAEARSRTVKSGAVKSGAVKEDKINKDKADNISALKDDTGVSTSVDSPRASKKPDTDAVVQPAIIQPEAIQPEAIQLEAIQLEASENNNDVQLATQSITTQPQASQPAPNETSGETPDEKLDEKSGEKWSAPPMPDADAVAEDKPAEDRVTPQTADPQTDSQTPMPILPPNRFSRRFGEIPLVG